MSEDALAHLDNEIEKSLEPDVRRARALQDSGECFGTCQLNKETS